MTSPDTPNDILSQETPVSDATKHHASKSDIAKLAGLVAIMAALFGICLAAWPYVSDIFAEGGLDLLVEKVREAGPIGVLILLGLQLLQVIVAFIPGEVTQIAAGMLYGPVWGGLVILFGAAIASAIVFELVHLLGAPFVRSAVPEHFLTRFREFEETGKLTFIVFILFLIPGLPKDTFTYMVGLTDMDLKTFLITSTFGRAPGIFVSAYAASNIMEGDYLLSGILFGVLALIALLGIVFKEKIFSLLSKKNASS